MASLHGFRKGFVSAALAAFLLTSATGARAQDPAAVAAAQALVDDGNRAASAGDFQTALDRFSAAYVRYKSPNILLNIATALHKLHRYAEAGNLYERYLRDPGASPQRIEDVSRRLAEIDAVVARLTISTAEPNARIWLDGRELPGFPSGGTIRVDPGEHTVAAGRTSADISQVVRVEARDTRTVWLGGAGPVAPAPRVVMVEVPPAPDGEPPPRRVRRSMSGQRIAGVVLDVVGGLGIATSLGLGITALVIHEDANDHCLDRGAACEPRALTLEKQSRGFARATDITLGAGAAVLLTGIIVGATAPRYDVGSSRGPRVAVGPGSISLEATW